MTLSAPATRRLLVSYHRTRDAAAREALVHRFLPLARHLARRYNGQGHLSEDLAQVAAIGLLKAIDRFDPSRGTEFSSFAAPTIIGELKRHFRDSTWAVRVPRGLQEQALHVSRAADALERELGRPPTAAQIAERTGVPTRDVLTSYDVLRARHGVPFEGAQEDDDRGPADRIGITDEGFRRAEDAVTLETLLAGLGDREREILRLRFGEDLKQSDIAERMGASQVQISRVIRRVTEKLSVAAEAAMVAC